MSSPAVPRIGVLVPSGNEIHEREFAALGPCGVEFQFAGFGYPAADTAHFCASLADRLAAPMAVLRNWGAHLIVLGCTTASMHCASVAEHGRLEAQAGVPLVTAAGAVREALAAMRLRRVVVATPYGESGNRIVSEFLCGSGIDVAALAGLGLDRSLEVWRREAPALTARQLLDFALAIDVADSQALYLPCTGVHSLGTIALYEAHAGKPALSSVQAAFWASLRRLGIAAPRDGAGRLLSEWDFA